MQYTLAVIGCDDKTSVKLELSQEEVDFLKATCEKISKASEYHCQPTMELTDGWKDDED